MRVVSLLPAATEIVAALGALPRLVGVSHECDYPPEARALPRVTRTRLDASLPSAEIDRAMAAARRTGTPPVEVDVKLIAHLRPDVILGQSLCDVCAVGESGLAQLVAARPGDGSTARSWRGLAALAPDLVVVALCGFDVARAQQELAAVTDRDARVLLGRRVGLLDGNAYTSRPGPRLVDAAEILARLIAG